MDIFSQHIMLFFNRKPTDCAEKSLELRKCMRTNKASGLRGALHLMVGDQWMLKFKQMVVPFLPDRQILPQEGGVLAQNI